MGADRAILLESDEELQPLAVAKLLNFLIAREQPDLILLGKQAIDDDCNQTGQMLSALTGLPQATFASRIDIAGGTATIATTANVVREIDGGQETLCVTLPSIITADLRLNEPRYVTLPNMMRARKKPIEILRVADLGVDVRPHMKTLKVTEPPVRRAGITVPDVAALIDQLKTRQVI